MLLRIYSLTGGRPSLLLLLWRPVDWLCLVTGSFRRSWGSCVPRGRRLASCSRSNNSCWTCGRPEGDKLKPCWTPLCVLCSAACDSLLLTQVRQTVFTLWYQGTHFVAIIYWLHSWLGCMLHGDLYRCLLYTDLLIHSMQMILRISDKFADNFDIIFTISKSVVMRIGSG